MTTDNAAGDLLSAEMLDVGDGHRLYVETVGQSDGIAAVYLHGGPGSGCQPSHRALFDRQRFRAVLFDQRGAGRSTPSRSRDHNTTQHLIADMERIRTHLGIERWLVVGGSWGATLGLAYAEAHPERVSGLVLRAVFLGTQAELEWAFGTAAQTFYPQLYADFLSLLSPEERLTPIASYWRRILDADPSIHGPAARAWHGLERVLSELRPTQTRLNLDEVQHGTVLPSTPFMEAYYFSNGLFLQPDQLLAQANRLSGIPGRIMQGQFDLLCPAGTSQRLAERWPDVRVLTVPAAGHAQTDPGVTEAMIGAIDELAG